MIYFDHARTSHPKLGLLVDAISKYICEIGVPPSRDTHISARRACEIFETTRKQLASLFHIRQYNHIFFSSNATSAANIILKGFLKEGDHVLVTAYEHNAIVRPLEVLKQEKNVSYSILQPDLEGTLLLDEVRQSITPQTRLIVASHIANSTGYVAPIMELSKISKEKGISLFIDAAQSAGMLDLDVEKAEIDFLIFTGHKHLLGPSGIGGGYVRHPELVQGLIQGGSSWGASHSVFHPESAPHKFEAGTPNYLGVAALHAALTHIEGLGIEVIHEKIRDLTLYCIHSLYNVPHVLLHSKENQALSIVSFTVEDLLPGEVAQCLFEKYDILVRSGVLCAPLIHSSLRTKPHGIIRASFGYSNTFEEIDRMVDALAHITKGSL